MSWRECMGGMSDVVKNMTVMDGTNELDRIYGRYV